MIIHITEGKSEHPKHNENMVRVFFASDYDYGFFIKECLVFDVLNDFQKSRYTKHDKFGINEKTAELLKQNGLGKPDIS